MLSVDGSSPGHWSLVIFLNPRDEEILQFSMETTRCPSKECERNLHRVFYWQCDIPEVRSSEF